MPRAKIFSNYDGRIFPYRRVRRFPNPLKGVVDVPELLRQLDDKDHYVQNAAVRALENIPDKSEIIVPALINRLPKNPMMVGEALEKFGTNLLPYSNQITKLIENRKVPIEWAPKLMGRTNPMVPSSNR